PLLCLDHGLRDPSSSKPYSIEPIENYTDQPALIEIIAAYGYGEIPPGAAQAAVWNLNSGVSWDELAAKLTGTERQMVREPYFSREEIEGAMAVVAHAESSTAGQTVEPREFKLPRKAAPGDDVAVEVTEAATSDADKKEADKDESEEKPTDPDKAEKDADKNDAATGDKPAAEASGEAGDAEATKAADAKVDAETEAIPEAEPAAPRAL
ncbi:MAG TPA: hypothetical protein VEQ85_00215, partial [Lacipirellulaceae bacterium]|nr:hypothetical protein [Lacipirellulaceae bacterium]